MALSKQEREQLFVQQRTAELSAAGKPVDAAALTARFNELSATPEGRKQITSKVQLANAPTVAPVPGPTQQELQAASDAQYNYRNSLLTPTGTAGTGIEEDATSPTYTTSEDVTNIITNFNAQQNADNTETASSILQATLKYYGMDNPQLLLDVKAALADRRLTASSTIDDIGIQLRESAAFQERFSANELRRAANKPAYSVSEYLQLESSYRNTLLSAGMPADFYNAPEDFANFIANDISPDEIKARVDQGYASVKNADPAIVNELKSLYGLDDSTLAAFFIDPARTKDAVITAARAAEVASQARQQAGITLGVPAAELLVQQGVTEEEARTGFTEVAKLQELTRPLQGEQALTQEELVAGTLGTNAAASQRVAMTQRRRKAGLEGGGKVELGTVGQ